MCSYLGKTLIAVITGSLLVLIMACDKATLPRFSHDEPPSAHMPISVTLAFDQELQAATMEVDACEAPYDIQVGRIMSEAFLQNSGESFAAVMAQQPPGSPTPVTGSSDLTIDVSLINQSFDAPGRFGADTYQAKLAFQLQAVYRNAQGSTLAQRPLIYKETVKIWTRQDGSSSASCWTDSLDRAVENAANSLARDMIGIVPSLFGMAPSPPTMAQGSTMSVPVPPVQAQAAPAPSLSFRTMLQDGNNDMALEGGEKLVLQIETTNTGSAPIRAVTVELTGTQTIVDAFTSVTSLPIALGALQPGETKSTEIRGSIPSQVEAERGELIVSVIPSDGSPPSSRRILAAVRPSQSPNQEQAQIERANLGGASPIGSNSHKGKAASRGGVTHRKGAGTQYYAIVVGMDRYRDPWPGARRIASDQFAGITDVLKAAGTFPSDQVRVLQGRRATKSDIEEALVDWARERVDQTSIFLFYFLGHALEDRLTGQVFLVPYEGAPTASTKRLISLQALHRVLTRLETKLTLLFLDTSITSYSMSPIHQNPSGIKRANWQGALQNGTAKGGGGVRLIQIRKLEGSEGLAPGGLLSGLLGRADRSQDGFITVGELLRDLGGRSTEIIPSLSPNSSFARIPLTQ